jgi:hypothetical protein
VGSDQRTHDPEAKRKRQTKRQKSSDSLTTHPKPGTRSRNAPGFFVTRTEKKEKRKTKQKKDSEKTTKKTINNSEKKEKDSDEKQRKRKQKTQRNTHPPQTE